MINSPLHRNPSDHYDEVLPPIWLWYICTNLKENGFNVQLFDAVAWKISIDQLIDYIEHWNFSYVWLNIFSTNHELVKEIITKVSSRVTFLIWWAFIKNNFESVLKWSTNNKIIAIIWEADTIVADILKWNIQEMPIATIWNNIAFKVDRNSKYFPHDISSLKLERSLFEFEPTTSALNWDKECNIIVSRWCVYDCAFCTAAVSLNHGTTTRIRSFESIKSEIDNLLIIHPDVKSIRILDDLFLRNSRSIENAVKIFSWTNLNWRAMAHIQSFKKIDSHLLCEVKKSGCKELSIWIESWNQQILNSINKANKIEEIYSTLEKIFFAGIWVKGYFIFWFPGETEEQFMDTYKLAKSIKELSLNMRVSFRISVFQFRPYHWTQLYYELLEKWHMIPWIVPNNSFWDKNIGEFDFWSWNFSSCDDNTLQQFIIKTRTLNDL